METDTNLETLFPEPQELARVARLAYDLFDDASHNLDVQNPYGSIFPILFHITGQAMGVPMETARDLVQWEIARMKELRGLQEGA